MLVSTLLNKTPFSFFYEHERSSNTSFDVQFACAHVTYIRNCRRIHSCGNVSSVEDSFFYATHSVRAATLEFPGWSVVPLACGLDLWRGWTRGQPGTGGHLRFSWIHPRRGGRWWLWEPPPVSCSRSKRSASYKEKKCKTASIWMNVMVNRNIVYHVNLVRFHE